MKYIALLLIIIIFSSCHKLFLDPEPEITNQKVFNEYATLIKEKYAMLEFKNVDIEKLTVDVGATVSNEMSEKELFEKLGELTLALKDGHSSLAEVADPGGDTTLMVANYDFVEGFAPAFDAEILFSNYLGKDINEDVTVLLNSDSTIIRMIYGSLPQQNDVAYVWIPSWNEELSEAEIEDVFEAAKDKKAMIVDIRQNTGGDPVLATKFASYFLKEKVNTGYERFKIGPGINDFKDSPNDLRPANSENLFHKDVVVLIDRYVYSAALTFSYSLFPLNNVTFIGQRAGGGSGSVADGYLLNGWYWSLSVSEYIDFEGNHLDDGFDPDIQVELDTEDKTKDEILERAIRFINEK